MSKFTWYIPSFNGDIRFEAESDDRTVVTVIDPTVGEIFRLLSLSTMFNSLGWCDGLLWKEHGDPKIQVTVLKAPIVRVAKYLVKAYAPGKAVLTAIKFKDDKATAYETGGELWDTMMKHLGVDTARPRDVEALILPDPVEPKKPEPLADATTDGDPYRGPTKALAKKEPETPSRHKLLDAAIEAIATVTRPTICCPRCVKGPLTPAGEVLFSFLSEDEKREYIENDHSFTVYGGITGFPYLLSHRHGKWARHFGKICHDLHHNETLHFHDHTVPPEEELLAAKLILEHREHWLRTYGACHNHLLHNPFGDYSDGTRSAGMTWQFGELVASLAQ